jgi:hypothetical protein
MLFFGFCLLNSSVVKALQTCKLILTAKRVILMATLNFEETFLTPTLYARNIAEKSAFKSLAFLPPEMLGRTVDR